MKWLPYRTHPLFGCISKVEDLIKYEGKYFLVEVGAPMFLSKKNTLTFDICFPCISYGTANNLLWLTTASESNEVKEAEWERFCTDFISVLPHAKRKGYTIKDFLAMESSRRKAFWTRLQCSRRNRYVKSSVIESRRTAFHLGKKCILKVLRV